MFKFSSETEFQCLQPALELEDECPPLVSEVTKSVRHTMPVSECVSCAGIASPQRRHQSKCDQAFINLSSRFTRSLQGVMTAKK